MEVFDSAFPSESGNPRMLLPDVSRKVKDCCDRLGWGDESAASEQLAIALLLDVTGDPGTARRWSTSFAAKYVSRLRADWSVPELDIALWLYCFENARPGA